MKKTIRTIRMIVSCILIAALISGCENKAGQEKPVSTSFFAMDTIMEISLYGDKELLTLAESRIKEIESALSATTGEVAKFNSKNAKGRLENRGNYDDVNPLDFKITLSSDVASVLESALFLTDFTGGLFDITIYPLMQLYGFGTDSPNVPDDATIAEYLKLVGKDRILFTRNFDGTGFMFFIPDRNVKEDSTLPGIGIDLGGIAKGFTGDRIIDMLSLEGVTSALLNLGGNVQVLGSKPDGSLWRIGVANPDDTSSQIGYIDVRNCAVVTSGSYQRYFIQDGVKYHHILDPRTGKPANSGLKSVTVIGTSGAKCDALSTAFFVAGVEKSMEIYRSNSYHDVMLIGDDQNAGQEQEVSEALKYFEHNLLGGGFEIIFVLDDGSVKVTKGLKDIFVPIGVKAEVIE